MTIDEMDTKDQPIENMTPCEWRNRLMYTVLGTLSLSENVPELIQNDLVYSAFFQLKARHPKWLGSLHFQTSKYATISKNLEDTLFYLGAFGLVTVENRDFRCLRFSNKDKAAAKNKMQKRIAENADLKELEDLSNEFANLVTEQPNACT